MKDSLLSDPQGGVNPRLRTSSSARRMHAAGGGRSGFRTMNNGGRVTAKNGFRTHSTPKTRVVFDANQNHTRVLDRSAFFHQSQGVWNTSKSGASEHFIGLQVYFGDWFHSITAMQTWHLLALCLSFYCLAVMFFACFYLLIDTYIGGDCQMNHIDSYIKALYFSLETMVTIGKPACTRSTYCTACNIAPTSAPTVLFSTAPVSHNHSTPVSFRVSYSHHIHIAYRVFSVRVGRIRHRRHILQLLRDSLGAHLPPGELTAPSRISVHSVYIYCELAAPSRISVHSVYCELTAPGVGSVPSVYDYCGEWAPSVGSVDSVDSVYDYCGEWAPSVVSVDCVPAPYIT
jgi:hypothetical protein